MESRKKEKKQVVVGPDTQPVGARTNVGTQKLQRTCWEARYLTRRRSHSGKL